MVVWGKYKDHVGDRTGQDRDSMLMQVPRPEMHSPIKAHA